MFSMGLKSPILDESPAATMTAPVCIINPPGISIENKLHQFAIPYLLYTSLVNLAIRKYNFIENICTFDIMKQKEVWQWLYMYGVTDVVPENLCNRAFLWRRLTVL